MSNSCVLLMLESCCVYARRASYVHSVMSEPRRLQRHVEHVSVSTLVLGLRLPVPRSVALTLVLLSSTASEASFFVHERTYRVV